MHFSQFQGLQSLRARQHLMSPWELLSISNMMPHATASHSRGMGRPVDEGTLLIFSCKGQSSHSYSATNGSLNSITLDIKSSHWNLEEHRYAKHSYNFGHFLSSLLYAQLPLATADVTLWYRWRNQSSKIVRDSIPQGTWVGNPGSTRASLWVPMPGPHAFLLLLWLQDGWSWWCSQNIFWLEH